MLEIDGSHGEGGGQILRTAIAMATLKQENIRIYNIRANRPNPGLSHQHMMAINALKEMSGAEVDGVHKGSKEIFFSPGKIKVGFYRFDIGTAGSITLLLQALIPPALAAQEELAIEVKGGTDVRWSPPYDYFENVFLRMLGKMDIEVSSELVKRGHYPKGGGKVKVQVTPSKPRRLKIGREVEKIQGRAFVTNLPDHIANRMKKSALKELLDYDLSITTESYSSPSAGTGITLWTEGTKVVGSGVLGEKGVPAEEVGKEVADKLKKSLDENVDLDPWCADQVIPYLTMLDSGGKLKIKEKTGHLETNVWLVNKFVSDPIKIKKEEGYYSIIY